MFLTRLPLPSLTIPTVPAWRAAIPLAVLLLMMGRSWVMDPATGGKADPGQSRPSRQSAANDAASQASWSSRGIAGRRLLMFGNSSGGCSGGNGTKEVSV